MPIYDFFNSSKQRCYHASKSVKRSKADQDMLARAMGHSRIIHDRDYVKVI